MRSPGVRARTLARHPPRGSSFPQSHLLYSIDQCFAHFVETLHRRQHEHLPRVGRPLPHRVETHSHVGDPQEQVRRRSVTPNPAPVHSGLWNSLLGSLLGSTVVELVEYRLQALLYHQQRLHRLPHDESVRKDTREGVRMEVSNVVTRWQPDPSASGLYDFQRLGWLHYHGGKMLSSTYHNTVIS